MSYVVYDNHTRRRVDGKMLTSIIFVREFSTYERARAFVYENRSQYHSLFIVRTGAI